MKIFGRSKTMSFEHFLKKVNITGITIEQIENFLNNEEKVKMLSELLSERKKTEEIDDENNKEGDNNLNNEKEAVISGKTKIIEKDIILLNGKVNQPFATKIELPDNIKEGVIIKPGNSVEDLDYDPETKSLKFTPVKSGDHEICLEYTLKKRFKLKIYVNDDPRSLWKDIPSNQTDKPDNDSGVIDNESFRILCASRRGRSHANEGKQRDDHYLMGTKDGWAVVVVADGAGSADNSALGSKIACEVALKDIMDKLPEKERDFTYYLMNNSGKNPDSKIKKILYDVLVGAAHTALKEIFSIAKGMAIPVKVFNTTLLVAITKRYTTGTFVATFSVGDGLIAAVGDNIENFTGISNNGLSAARGDNVADLLCKPDIGKYKGETFFINSDNIFSSTEKLLKRLFFRFYEKPRPLVLCTDGIIDPFELYWDEETVDNTAFIKLWKEIKTQLKDSDKPGEKLLEWLNFYVTAEHDDRTISIIEYK